jgi:gamma-glutamyltranspeptidase/glutathione hydrolase
MPHLGRRLGAVTAALAMSVTTGALASPASAHPRQADNVEENAYGDRLRRCREHR